MKIQPDVPPLVTVEEVPIEEGTKPPDGRAPIDENAFIRESPELYSAGIDEMSEDESSDKPLGTIDQISKALERTSIMITKAFKGRSRRQTTFQKRGSQSNEDNVVHGCGNLSHRWQMFFISFVVCLLTLLLFAMSLSLCEHDHYERRLDTKRYFYNQTQEIYKRRNLTEGEIRTVYTYYDLDFNLEDDNPWTFRGAMYFCATVMSTVGYGWNCPTTNTGLVLMTVFLIPSIVAFMLTSFYYAYAWLFFTHHIIFQKILGRQDMKVAEVENKSVMLLLLLIWFVSLGVLTGFTFITEEDWTVWQSMFYVIVTGTAVGVTGDLKTSARLTIPQALLAGHGFLIFIGISFMFLELFVDKFDKQERALIAKTAKVMVRTITNQETELQNLKNVFDNMTAMFAQEKHQQLQPIEMSTQLQQHMERASQFIDNLSELKSHEKQCTEFITQFQSSCPNLDELLKESELLCGEGAAARYSQPSKSFITKLQRQHSLASESLPDESSHNLTV